MRATVWLSPVVLLLGVAVLLLAFAFPAQASGGRCTHGEWRADGKRYVYSHSDSLRSRHDHVYEVLERHRLILWRITGLHRVTGCPPH